MKQDSVEIFVRLRSGEEVKVSLQVGKEDPRGVHHRKPEFEEVFEVVEKLGKKRFLLTSDLGE